MMRVQLDYQAHSARTWRDWLRRLYAMMTGPRARRAYLRMLVVCIVLAISGYVSDLVTVHSCQSDTARYVYYGDLSSRPFWTPDLLSSRIFRSSGITPAYMNPYGPPWQHASIQPNPIRWPFIVSVAYSDNEGQWEQGGRRTYFCFFGAKVLLSEYQWPRVVVVH